jgi:hypothetical protein
MRATPALKRGSARARRLPSEFAAPLVVWAIVVMGLVTVTTSNRFDPFQALTWARWDSGQYKVIAAYGYDDVVPCPPSSGYGPGTWCGDAGWFPAYPRLVRAVYELGSPVLKVDQPAQHRLGGAAVAVSWLFALGTLLLLWATFLRRNLDAAAIGCLLFAAYVPGQIYHYAVFPLSMLAFFTVLHLWFLDRRRWLAAGLAGAVAAATYPIGVMLVPISAIWIALILVDAPWRERARRVALASGITACGFIAVLVDMRVETGHWDAYFLIQAKYGHGLHNPAAVFVDAVRPVFHGSLLGTAKAPALQTLLVGLILGCVFLQAALRWRRLTALDGLLLVWAAFYSLFPLTQANVSLLRSQAALLPLALLVRHLPRPLLFLTVGALLWLSVPITELFLSGKLV